MCLNHPETILQPWSVEKLFTTKLVLGAKKVGDPLLSSLSFLTLPSPSFNITNVKAQMNKTAFE